MIEELNKAIKSLNRLYPKICFSTKPSIRHIKQFERCHISLINNTNKDMGMIITFYWFKEYSYAYITGFVVDTIDNIKTYKGK